MDKILFITSRNIINSSGEMRLIKNRSLALQNKHQVYTNYINIFDKNKLKNKKEELETQSSIKSEIYSKSNPLSFLLAMIKTRKNIITEMKSQDYNGIIISGILAMMFTKTVFNCKNKNQIMIADIHGALEEIIEFNKYKGIKKHIRICMFKILKILERINVKYFDRVLTVSRALEDYVKNEYNLRNINTHIIPCSIEANLLSDKEYEENRKNYRKKYRIKDELLFIYSGGTSAWQNIDKAVEIFESIRNNNTAREPKMLILTMDIEKIKHFANKKNIYMDSASPSEVSKILCAGDYAFLLRDNYITNNVSFPNKFLEYVNSRMKVITTPYIFDVAEIVENYQLGVIIDNYNKLDIVIDYIKRTPVKKSENKKREKLLANLSFEVTTTELANAIKDCKN